MAIGDPPPAPPPGARFEFATATRIIFGAGSAGDLPSLAASLGRALLVVTGANPVRHGALLDRLRGAVDRLEVFPVAGEPTVDLVETGALHAREQRIDCVIAIGGGSAIDAGKAIAGLAANPAPALEYLEVVGRGRPLKEPSLPFVAVPTTSGTGAEVTRNAVLAVPSARVKVSLRSAHLLPRIAVVDPNLTNALPPETTATTGMDALTQLIEPLLSHRANPLTDALCRDGIRRVARALPSAWREPDNSEARADLALGALYSGMALANAGLGAVHGFAAPIGGLFPAPHGAVCAALLPHVLRANFIALRAHAPDHQALRRLDELGFLLTENASATAEDAIEFCTRLARDLAVPPLIAWGMTKADIPAVVEKAAAASSMKANPIVLSSTELTALLTAALGGR